MINSKELLAYTKNLSILFVEDHDELRISTSEILKNFFKEVITTTNGKDALDQYQDYLSNNSRYIDLILSDIQMPMLNGVELTEAIYRLNSNQIIVILSAHDESKYLLPLINLGIEQFIKKPIDFQELLNTLFNASKKLLEPRESKEQYFQTLFKLNNDFIYNRESHSLSQNMNNIYLTKYEIIFLDLLTKENGKIYSNNDIVHFYYVLNENIDAQNIRKLVSKIRKKLPENTIESIYGVGYKINSIKKF